MGLILNSSTFMHPAPLSASVSDRGSCLCRRALQQGASQLSPDSRKESDLDNQMLFHMLRGRRGEKGASSTRVYALKVPAR